MQTANLPIRWGIACEIENSGEIISEGCQDAYETSSSIKSAIGLSAIRQATELGHDVYDFTVSVNGSHESNGSGRLRDTGDDIDGRLLRDDRASEGSALVTLKTLIELNIIDSDCMATNALIDYVGGKEAVNKLLAEFDCHTTRLCTDRIDFPGVNHTVQPFQVGMSNPIDMVRYYQHLVRAMTAREPFIKEFFAMHLEPKYARLFGLKKQDVPTSVSWLHKTGSMFEHEKATGFYGCVNDGGLLSVGGIRRAIICGMSTVLVPDATESLERQFCLEVAELNVGYLERIGVLEEGQVAPFSSTVELAA